MANPILNYRVVWYRNRGKHKATNNHAALYNTNEPLCKRVVDADNRVADSLAGRVDCATCRKLLAKG